MSKNKLKCYRCAKWPCKCDDGCTILHGDCRELLQGIDVDVIVSDPPYGIKYKHSGQRSGGLGNTKHNRERGVHYLIGDTEPFDPSHLLNFHNVLLWGADHYRQRLPNSGRFLAWNKLAGMESFDSFSDVEFAWHSIGGASRIISLKWKGLICKKYGEDSGKRVHPTQKPKRLMQWSIEQTKSVGIICDPYCGSGTTLIAAKQLGRKAIGIEIEEKYCAIAAKRLDRTDVGLLVRFKDR